MRLLACVLLFASLAWGQTQDFLRKQWRKENPPSPYLGAMCISIGTGSKVSQWQIGRDTIYTQGGNLSPLFLPGMLRFWHEYKDSCWSDSIATEKWISDQKMSDSLGTDILIRTMVWTKRPRNPTFPEFMEFLERRKK
jgi:hypothetical protein